MIERRHQETRNVLADTDLCLSRFAFGTASLHYLLSSRSRRALLEAVVAHGFTHFDTAPIYGFGLAERELAPLLAAEPTLTVATKVGLYPPGGADQPRAVMLARKVLGKLYPALSRVRVGLSVRRAEASLSASLRRLGRKQIDILFVHEPDAALIRTEEWQRWLETELDRGRLRAFGIAGVMSRLEPFLSNASPLARVVQTADSLTGREADRVLRAGRPLQITYGYLSAARASGKPFDPHSVLVQALQRNKIGTILVSTRRCERLAEYTAALAAAGNKG